MTKVQAITPNGTVLIDVITEKDAYHATEKATIEQKVAAIEKYLGLV